MRKKGFGVSPITNTIFYGTQDTEKHMWVGQKTDVTDDAIMNVYQWFMGNMDGKEEYSITYPSTEYELVMRRKEKKVNEIDTQKCVAEWNMGYQQGRVDMIDEFVKAIEKHQTRQDSYFNQPYVEMGLDMTDVLEVAEQLKEKRE